MERGGSLWLTQEAMFFFLLLLLLLIPTERPSPRG